MKKPVYSEHIKHWSLDQECVFLNHGSFGACPQAVLDYQSKLRKKLESQPLRFMMRELEYLNAESKQILADFLNADYNDLVFVKNVTEGVNTVLNSIKWHTHDRVLITNQIYPACFNAVMYYARKFNFEVDVAEIPYPLTNSREIIRAVLKCIRPDTKLLILDHISSTTSIVFPVSEIAAALKDIQIQILVDGAHAPGAIPLNMKETVVHYYTGNCHKWLCSPKGAAFLWVDPAYQDCIYPLAISMINSRGNDFQDRFYWTGTQDPTAHLCIPAAIQILKHIAGTDLHHIMNQNKQLNIKTAKIICDALNISFPCPENLLSAMTSIPLPDLKTKHEINSPDPLQEKLYKTYHIEIPVMKQIDSEQRFLRISCQLYNHISQYRYLADALIEIGEL